MSSINSVRNSQVLYFSKKNKKNGEKFLALNCHLYILLLFRDAISFNLHKSQIRNHFCWYYQKLKSGKVASFIFMSA